MPREMTSVGLRIKEGDCAWLGRSSCFPPGSLSRAMPEMKDGRTCSPHLGLTLVSPSVQSAAGHPPRPGGMLLLRIQACQEILVSSDKPLLILLVTSGLTVFPDCR